MNHHLAYHKARTNMMSDEKCALASPGFEFPSVAHMQAESRLWCKAHFTSIWCWYDSSGHNWRHVHGKESIATSLAPKAQARLESCYMAECGKVDTEFHIDFVCVSALQRKNTDYAKLLLLDQFDDWWLSILAHKSILMVTSFQRNSNSKNLEHSNIQSL